MHVMATVSDCVVAVGLWGAAMGILNKATSTELTYNRWGGVLTITWQACTTLCRHAAAYSTLPHPAYSDMPRAC